MWGVTVCVCDSVHMSHYVATVSSRLCNFASCSQEMAELIKKEPSHVTLEWVLRLIQHVVESDPDQIFIIDIVPSLKWLIRDEHLIKECTAELEAFEQKVHTMRLLSLGFSLSVCLYVCLSVCLYVCMSVCQWRSQVIDIGGF